MKPLKWSVRGRSARSAGPSCHQSFRSSSSVVGFSSGGSKVSSSFFSSKMKGSVGVGDGGGIKVLVKGEVERGNYFPEGRNMVGVKNAFAKAARLPEQSETEVLPLHVSLVLLLDFFFLAPTSSHVVAMTPLKEKKRPKE